MISLRNVSISYEEVPVCTNMNFALPSNEFIFIIGKNGCGKSTLLRAVSGLIPYTGTIQLDTVEIRNMKRKERSRLISYLPQTHPAPMMDVETLIAHGRYPHLGFSKTLREEDMVCIADAAKKTGVSSLLKRNLSELSGGELQRAYIAMMLAQNADVMMLDEPIAHLDIEYQLEIMQLLRELHNNGKTVLVVSHDLPQAFHFATHIVLLANGNVVAYGRPQKLCEDECLKQIFGVTIRKATDGLYAYQIAKG